MKISKKALASLAGSTALAFVAVFVPTGTASAQVQAGIDAANTNNTPQSLFADGGIFQLVVNVLLFIIGAISVIMLIFGGIRYTISAGDSSAVTAAKNTILYAIIGLIIAFLAFALVNWVLAALSGNATTA